MQLPAVAFPVGTGKKYLFVTELVNNLDYTKIIHHLNFMPPKSQLNFSKEEMREICSLASSKKDMNLIKYVAIKSHNLNTTQSRQMLGVDDPKSLVQNISDAISQQQQIREALWDLALAQAAAEQKAAEGEVADNDLDQGPEQKAKEGDGADSLDSESDNDPPAEIQDLIQTDSETDDPEDYLAITNTNGLRVKEKVKKLSQTIYRRTERKFAKKISQESLLKRKLPKHVSRILLKYPDIGKIMENYVHDNLVGADAWRQTRVLTFNRNLKREKRVTYQRIQQYLQKTLSGQVCMWNYSTVVCVPQ